VTVPSIEDAVVLVHNDGADPADPRHSAAMAWIDGGALARHQVSGAGRAISHGKKP
jgi:hypothetical protein